MSLEISYGMQFLLQQSNNFKENFQYSIEMLSSILNYNLKTYFINNFRHANSQCFLQVDETALGEAL